MTTDVVTATIVSSETVETLKTLTGVNEYSITINAVDSTSTTAADLNAINALTSVPVNLINVTALAASSLSDLDTLAAAITDNEFSNVAGLTTLAVSDITIDASALASAIDSLDEINGESTTGMTLAAGATINVDASEVTEMLDDETAGRLTISDQAITVTGEISVDTANLLNETTSGVVTASIATTEIVDQLTTLAGTGNAYTIVIAEEDATGSTADELTAIDNATTVGVDATAVTEVTGSNTEINTLYGSGGVNGLGDEIIIITNDPVSYTHLTLPTNREV